MSAISINSDWQLFLDDYIIDRMTGLSRIVHHPKKCGVVLEPDKPWETFGCQGANVFIDECGKWHMLYNAIWWDSNAAKDLPENASDRAHHIRTKTAYAESEDGIHWEKPVLRLQDTPAHTDYQGELPEPAGITRENNCGVPFEWFCDLASHGNINDPGKKLILYSIPSSASAPGHVIETVHIECDEPSFFFARQWPNFLNDPCWRDELTPIPGARFSPRGWRDITGWEETNKEWISFGQGHWVPGRNIVRYASKDLREWYGMSVLAPDSEDSHTIERYDEFNSITVSRCSDFWIGFLDVFHGDRSDPGYLAPGLSGDCWRKGTIDIQLVVSRDGGRNWRRVANRQTWLPCGTEENSLDRLVVFSQKPIRKRDEMWIYYTGSNCDHLQFLNDDRQRPYRRDHCPQRRILLAKQRWNGYVSINAGAKPEALVTKPVIFRGNDLYINADAGRGEIRIEAIEAKNGPPGDPSGHWIEAIEGFNARDCKPIQGSGVKQEVRWKGGKNLASLAGKPVRLRFLICNAELYGFCVR